MKKTKLRISLTIFTIIISVMPSVNVFSQNVIINFGYFNANQISDVNQDLNHEKSDSAYIKTLHSINSIETKLETNFKDDISNEQELKIKLETVNENYRFSDLVIIHLALACISFILYFKHLTI